MTSKLPANAHISISIMHVTVNIRTQRGMIVAAAGVATVVILLLSVTLAKSTNDEAVITFIVIIHDAYLEMS